MNSRRSYKLALVVWVWLGLVGSVSSFAVQLTGSFTSELYTWTEERAEHIRPYQRLNSNFTFLNRADQPTLDWYTSLRWTTDFSDKFESDPQLNIYQTYLRLGRFYDRTELRLGRMFVYNGLGSGFIDGLYLRDLTVKGADIDLYAGSRVDQLDPESVRSLSDYLNFGSLIKWRLSPEVNLIHSVILTRDAGESEQFVTGLQADISHNNLYGVTRANYGINDKRLHTISGLARLSLDKWTGTIQAGSILPTVRANSIFAIIDAKRRDEARLALTRVLKDDWRLTGSAKFSLVEDNNQTRVSLGLRSNRYYLLWTNQSGDQSSANGVRAGINGKLFVSWRLFASGGYNSYMVQDEIESDLTAWHIRTGLTKRISQSLEARAELQLLSNADSENDLRALISLSKAFDIGGKE